MSCQTYVHAYNKWWSDVIVEVIYVDLQKVIGKNNKDTFFALKGAFTKYTPILRI